MKRCFSFRNTFIERRNCFSSVTGGPPRPRLAELRQKLKSVDKDHGAPTMFSLENASQPVPKKNRDKDVRKSGIGVCLFLLYCYWFWVSFSCDLLEIVFTVKAVCGLGWWQNGWIPLNLYLSSVNLALSHLYVDVYAFIGIRVALLLLGSTNIIIWQWLCIMTEMGI